VANSNGNPLGVALDRAAQLQEARVELQDAIGRNRTFLRGAASEGLLTDEQMAYVAEVYPTKQRKTAEAVVA
jgi:hypothetical protein